MKRFNDVFSIIAAVAGLTGIVAFFLPDLAAEWKIIILLAVVLCMAGVLLYKNKKIGELQETAAAPEEPAQAGIQFLSRQDSVDTRMPLSKFLMQYNDIQIMAASGYNLLTGDTPILPCLEKGIRFSFVLMDPKEPAARDFFENKVVWANSSRQIREEQTVRLVHLYSAQALKNRYAQVSARVCPFGLSYATMIAYKRNRQSPENDDYMQIDLYSIHTNDNDRRVLKFHRADAPAHFAHFEEEYRYVFEHATEIDAYLQHAEQAE